MQVFITKRFRNDSLLEQLKKVKKNILGGKNMPDFFFFVY